MLTGEPNTVNPILDESFKEEIIKAADNPEPVQPVAGADGRTQINITQELISQWLPRVVERFNICACGRCRAAITAKAMEDVRPIIVRVYDDSDIRHAALLKASRQHVILMQLIRIAVERRDLPRHNG